MTTLIRRISDGALFGPLAYHEVMATEPTTGSLFARVEWEEPRWYRPWGRFVRTGELWQLDDAELFEVM